MGLSINDRIEELPISKSIIRKLLEASLSKVENLALLCEREVLAIPGIGKKNLGKIKSILSSNDISLAEDPYPVQICARHNKARNDARLRTYYLCRRCAKEFKLNGFNGAPEIFTYKIEGGQYYCSHCNKKKAIAIYQWLVCEWCDRIVRSVGRSYVASSAVHNRWADLGIIHPNLPTIKEIDTPVVRSFSERSKPTLDFLWMDNSGNILFGAELKTGRNHMKGGSIGTKMSQFQLDIGDINDIIAGMGTDNNFIPAYVFHSQVVNVPRAPTSKFECVGIWWTAIEDLLKSITQIRERSKETKLAAYIKTKTFHKLETFVDEIKDAKYADCPPPSKLSGIVKSKMPK